MEENEIPDFFEERDLFGQVKPKLKISEKEILKSQEPVIGEEYAGLGLRILAYIIDIFIMIVPSLLSMFIFIGPDFLHPQHSLKRLLLSITLWGLYYGTTESSDKQGTVGKRIVGIKVIDENGNKLTFKRAVFRYLALYLSVIPLGLGIWTIAKDEKKQGWHDMLTDCYVIMDKQEPSNSLDNDAT
jgi:uncharacterized RDD family membrane protein YckC